MVHAYYLVRRVHFNAPTKASLNYNLATYLFIVFSCILLMDMKSINKLLH